MEGRRKIQGYAAQFAREISDMLRRIPRPLLLLLKTNDCLRTVDACLGQVWSCTSSCATDSGNPEEHNVPSCHIKTSDPCD